MKLLQVTVVPWLVLMIFLTNSFSQDNLAKSPTDTAKVWPYGWWMQHLVKVAPSFADDRLYGGIVQHETGLGHPNFALYTSLRYVTGRTGSQAGDVSIPAHFKLEFQPRYYPIYFWHPIYLAPLVNINSNGQLAGGLTLGWQALAWEKLPIDIGIALQSKTKTESYDSPLFLRLHMGIGLAFPANKNKDDDNN